MGSGVYRKTPKRAVILTIISSVLLGCPDPDLKLYFQQDGQETDHLDLQFANEGLELRISGSDFFVSTGEYRLILYIKAQSDDSMHLAWNPLKAAVLFDGEAMKLEQPLDRFFFDSSRRAFLRIDFITKFHFDKVWPQGEGSFVAPDIRLALDSCIVLDNSPLHMDTIEVLIRPESLNAI